MIVDSDLGSAEGGGAALAKLGLAADADARSVRQAYAQQLKQIDISTEAEAFQSLRVTYEAALAAVQARAAPPRDPVPATLRNPAVPALSHEDASLDLTASAALAVVTLDDFADRLAAGLGSTEDAAALLVDTLGRLASLEAGSRFELHVAALLAGGWQPGHEFLFDAARATFSWGEDRRDLAQFGEVGTVLQEALIERQAFFDQSPAAVERQLRLICRLRGATPPSRTLRKEEQPVLRVLVRRYPRWLSIVTPIAHVAEWLGGPEAFRAALAAPEPARPTGPSGQISGWQIFGFLLWVALMAWQFLHRR